MDYFYFILFILALIAVLILLIRADRRTRSKYKKTAYRLLETANPDSKEVKDTIKGLRLYGGRIRKDKESVQLVNRLLDKFDRHTD